MSKKCPFTRAITTKHDPYDCDVTTVTERFGDCVEIDCPYYQPDPAVCIRAQRPDDDAPKTMPPIGFDALNNYGKS